MPVKNPTVTPPRIIQPFTAADPSVGLRTVSQAAQNLAVILNTRKDEKSLEELRTDLQVQESRALTEPLNLGQLDLLSPEDEPNPQIRDFVNRNTQLKAALTQGRIRETQFAIESEQLLRRAIRQNPGLEAELIQQAQRTVGFNPIGTTLRAIGNVEEAAIRQEAEVFDDIARFGETHLNRSLALAVTKDQQVEYFSDVISIQGDLEELARRTLRLDLITSQEGIDKSVALARFRESFGSEEGRRFTTTGARIDINPVVSKYYNVPVKELEDLREAGQVAQDITTLEQERARTIEEAMDMTNQLLSVQEVEQIIKPALDLYTTAIDLLESGEFTESRMEAAFSIKNNATRANDQVFKLMILGEMIENFENLGAQGIGNRALVSKTFNAYNAELHDLVIALGLDAEIGTDTNYNNELNRAEEIMQNEGDPYVQGLLRGLENTVSSTTNSSDPGLVAFAPGVRLLGDLTTKRLENLEADPNELRRVFDLYTSPTFENSVSQFDPQLQLDVRNTAILYANEHFNTVKNTLDGRLRNFARAAQVEAIEEAIELVDVSLEEGVVEWRLKEDTPGQNTLIRQNQVNRLNFAMSTINSYVEMASKFKKIPKHQVLLELGFSPAPEDTQ
jgi:hypothetical protein